MPAIDEPLSHPITRRSLLKTIGAGAVALSAGGLAEACGLGSVKGTTTNTGKITIGYVSPQTGEAAGFAAGDNYVVNKIRAAAAYKDGFKVGGKGYNVEIVVKDSQSNPNRASQVAQDLVNSGVDIVLAASTPEVTNPVADICEAGGVPCVSTIVPWEAWYFGRGAKPGSAFNFTTMFFFGLGEFAGCFVPMWDRMNTNNLVAEMDYPNDADGGAFRANFPGLISKFGYKSLDGGAYADGTTDYTAMISKFKDGGAQLFSNVPLPPDFNTFWKQASQQGFKPKLATVAKVLLFPADVTALGSLVNNIATDCWWSPFHPYKSSLTGESAKDLADGFEKATGQQWLQSLGSVHSLFEIAQKALTSVSDPHNKPAVAAALKSLKYTGISGTLDWTAGPMPGVAIQQPVGVQWKKGTKYPWSMYVVDNTLNKNVPLNGTLEPTFA